MSANLSGIQNKKKLWECFQSDRKFKWRNCVSTVEEYKNEIYTEKIMVRKGTLMTQSRGKKLRNILIAH